MKYRVVTALAILIPFAFLASSAPGAPGNAAGEYSIHLGALSKLSVAVAQAMPADQYSFRPHPESMTFGQLVSHIATTNIQFCAGLKDSTPPELSSPVEKDDVIQYLSLSFDYCSTVISNLSDDQLSKIHNSPDGRLPGREVLLAMYVHVAHHRGQAEIYLRDKGIKPPSYMI
jgi:uncharacterized damage-inducible protein DinB